MGDLIRGESFNAGESVTAARLHKLVEEAVIKDKAVTEPKLADGCVSQRTIATAFNLAPGSIQLSTDRIIIGDAGGRGAQVQLGATFTKTPSFDIATGKIGLAMLADGILTTTTAGWLKMNDKFVTPVKMADITPARLWGRVTATAGPPEEITLGAGLAFDVAGKVLNIALGAGANVEVYSGPVPVQNAAGNTLGGQHTLKDKNGVAVRPTSMRVYWYPVSSNTAGYQVGTGWQDADIVPYECLRTASLDWKAVSAWCNNTRWAVQRNDGNETLQLNSRAIGNPVGTTGNNHFEDLIDSQWRVLVILSAIPLPALGTIIP